MRAAMAENAVFAEHPALVVASRSGFRPLLLRKAEFGDGGLAAEAREISGSLTGRNVLRGSSPAISQPSAAIPSRPNLFPVRPN
jgi:hypothetical protein